MLEALFFGLAIIWFYRHLNDLATKPRAGVVKTKRFSQRVLQLADLADQLYQSKKFLAAEKAYLEVLKHDHKHVAAYNRLGMIYSALKNRADAIECFKIVTRYSSTAQSHHNLGLAYFENKNYVKAAAAFEKSIMFEPSPARYIALAKSYQKILNKSKMLQALEKAVELEPSKPHLLLLAEAYAITREKPKANDIYRQILEIDPEDPKARRALAN